MSMNELRTDIAAAADTVDGVTATPDKPTSPQVGSGWVIWRESIPMTSGLFDARFRLLVVLPENYEAALDELHRLIDEVTTAIQIGVVGSAVETVRPGKLAGDNSPPIVAFDVRAGTTYGG